MLFLTGLALAGPRLVLIGDTGIDNAFAAGTAEAIRAEMKDPNATLLAIGDLYYHNTRVGADCVAKVVARRGVRVRVAEGRLRPQGEGAQHHTHAGGRRSS